MAWIKFSSELDQSALALQSEGVWGIDVSRLKGVALPALFMVNLRGLKTVNQALPISLPASQQPFQQPFDLFWCLRSSHDAVLYGFAVLVDYRLRLES